MSCVDAEHSGQDYPVKVLDCDSITQVKEKALDVIYRNTPFSRRPRPENLDLEVSRIVFNIECLPFDCL